MKGIPSLINYTNPSIIPTQPRHTVLVVEVDLDTQTYSFGPVFRSPFFPARGVVIPQKRAARTSLGGGKDLL